MLALGLLAFVLAALAGCGAGEDTVTLYLKQRLGPEGPPGQIAAVLEPVERERRAELPPAVQVLVQLRQGPSPDERAHGFEPTISSATRFTRFRIRRGAALVDVAGEPLDLYGLAAVVYSLTELEGVERVRVCCGRRLDGTRVFVHTRRAFTGWQGEPCALRAENRCLRDR